MIFFFSSVGSPTATPPMAYPSKSSFSSSSTHFFRRSRKVEPWMIPKMSGRLSPMRFVFLSKYILARFAQAIVRSRDFDAYSYVQG